jgi:hypothetical protein
MDAPKRLKPVDPYTVALGALHPEWTGPKAHQRAALECDCPVHSGEKAHRLRFDLVEPYAPPPAVIFDKPAQPLRFWEVHGEDFHQLTLDPAVVLPCFRGFLFEGNFLITWKAA